MRLAFLGSPETAALTLEALLDAGHDIPLVVTQPDRKRGRGGAMVPTPVKAFAIERGIPVTTAVDDVMKVGADMGIVVAFGKLIRPHVLDALSMVNVHFSLLPRWRGAAPVERAILAGDVETGVCLMHLDEGLDTGPVYACARLAIGTAETANELRARLGRIGTTLLISRLDTGLGTPEPQRGEATYAAKIDPAELRLDWQRSARDLHRVVRIGRAWTTFRGRRLQVLGAKPVTDGPPAGELDGVVVGCSEGGLELLRIQVEGGRPVTAEAWRNGSRPLPRERLGE